MKPFWVVVLLTLATAALAAPGDPKTSGTTNDPVRAEYQRVLDLDDTAQEEVDEWIRKNQVFADKGGGIPPSEMKRRILERFEPVGKAYERFIAQHPKHVEARIAYASFLGDRGNEDGARASLEQALALDTNNAAVYNNLANIYGHSGPVKKAFEFYARAIELKPGEPVYYHNYGTTVYLFRQDAREHFGLTDSQVFDKAVTLYSNAMRLDPTNFPLATDIAQTYYGIQPLRVEEALKAWTNTLRLAHDDIEREGVYLHLARVNMMAGRHAQAQAHLDAVRNPLYDELKARLARSLAERAVGSAGTNALPSATDKPVSERAAPLQP